MAATRYIDNNTVPGTKYSFSQHMNWALLNGTPLSTQQQQCYNGIMNAMHDLGHDMQLTRYDHIDFLDNALAAAGISGSASNMSVAQLNSALTGFSYSENRLLSASTNDFSKAPSGSKSTFMSREVQIVYDASPTTQVMMPGNGGGGNLGEVVIKNSGTPNFTITSISYNGRGARTKGMPQSVTNAKQIQVHVTIN